MAGKSALLAPPLCAAVKIGERVAVRFENGSVREFTIVDRNGNPETGTISSDSPLGSALIGRHASEETRYRVGEKEFCVCIIAVAGDEAIRKESS